MTDGGWVVTLPPSLEAPALARRHLRTLAEAALLSAETIDDALLMTSELVTNAVQHGAPAVTLSVRVDGGVITVVVTDNGAALPGPQPSVPPVDSPHGRGLHIVSTLATRWGVHPVPAGRGKSVWFVLQPAD